MLTHRYPFDTNANDVVGGADGVLQGKAYLTNGAVVLDGTNSSVLLPPNLFTNYDSITFEIWFADETLAKGSATTPGAFLYDFSGPSGGMSCGEFAPADVAPGAQGYLTLGSSSERVYFPFPTAGRTNHYVWTQDSSSQTARIYMNGVLASQNTNFTYTPAQIGPTTNWIGRGKSLGVFFRGSIVEVRVYQGALTALEVAQVDAAGPDQPQVIPGDLQNIQIMVPSPVGPGAALVPGVLANYANLTNVNIMGAPELALTSDNTNVIAVTTAINQMYIGNVTYALVPLLTTSQKLRTVGLGTASVTAIYQGFSNSVAVTVVVPQSATLLHRYSFGEPAGTTVAHDTIGGAHGRLVSAMSFTGKGEATTSGSTYSYVALPAGVLSCLSEVTLEAWVTWKGSVGGSWTFFPRIFDFGDQNNVGPGGPAGGITYFYLTPNPGSPTLHATISTYGVGGESPNLNWTDGLKLNVTSHVAVAYSPVRGVAKLFANGSLVASGVATIPLAAINDINNWLGKSQWTQDAYFGGRYDEFRIYSGFLQDSEVAASYAAGPNIVGLDFLLRPAVSGTNLTLSWGPAMAGWNLESTTQVVAGAVWAPESTATTNQDGRYSVSLPVSDSARYFRLHVPQARAGASGF